jgi:hypothetical protein
VLNFTLQIDDLVLPINMDQLKEILTPNETSTRTLDGTLVTDFVSNLRSWQVHFPEMDSATYDLLVDRYNSQYREERYVNITVAAYGIFTTAKLTLGDKNIRKAGVVVQDLTINLAEQYAYS